ncbi:hypothetical protein HWV62_38983 [Athelia sp. TMB]|nr:hypothetical protein HWV62_38983 [Athelia sp. TMB]
MVRPNTTEKAKSRVKRRAPSGSSDPFVDEADQAEGWMEIIEIFCRQLALPDFSTKQGVKTILKNYERIYERLERLYDLNSTNPKVVGGVIAIYTRLCAKTCLRNELFKDGFLRRYLPLLDSTSCRPLAFRALMAIAHHGGPPARTEIARHVPAFLKSISDHPDDPQTTEYALITIAHALQAVAGDRLKTPNAKTWKNIDLMKVLNEFSKALNQPMVSHTFITHTLKLYASLTFHFGNICVTHMPTMKFLVASLRSKNVSVRCTALDAMFGIYRNGEGYKSVTVGTIMAALKRGYPPHLYQHLAYHGRDRTDTITTIKASVDLRNAFSRYAQDRDLHALGATLASVILSTDNIDFQGTFQLAIAGRGTVETNLIEALPHCATAIRGKGGDSAKLDISDVLVLKYFLVQQGHIQTIAYAQQAIARNPGHGYFYLALSMCEGSSQALRAAKKGLRCQNVTPFVGYTLLQRAAYLGASLGTTTLLTFGGGAQSSEWGLAQTVGVAYLSSAVRDSMRYLQGAPPDQVNAQQMLHWYILLSVTMCGPALHPDMREIQSAISRLSIAYEFGNFWGIGAPRTKERLVQEAVTGLYRAATKEWASVIERFDNLANGKHPLSSTKAEDDLGAWLDNADDGNSQSAKYCDMGCLQSHAAEHRPVCGSATTLQAAPPKLPPTQPAASNRAWVGYPPAAAQVQSELPIVPGYVCEEVRDGFLSISLAYLINITDRLMRVLEP